MKRIKTPLACAIALSLATLCSPMTFADNLSVNSSLQSVEKKEILHYFSVAEDDFSLIDPYMVLKPGDSISQNLLITKTEPLASDVIPVDYLTVAGVYVYTGGENDAQLTIIDAETGDMVHRQPLILKRINDSGLNKRTRPDSPMAMKVVEFSSPVFLTAGKQYTIVIDVNEGSEDLRLHLLDGESALGNAVISSQGGQGQEVDNPLWLRAYASVEWNEYPLTIENDVNNKLAFDPGWATPAPEKLIDPSGPAEVLWVNHGDIDTLISYQLLDDTIADLIVERGALRDKLVIKATAEGKTAVVLKTDDTIVDKIILRSYKPFTIPVSYRYVAYPGEPIFDSWYRGINEHIHRIYEPLNIKVELFDLGVQTYEWDLNGDNNSYGEADSIPLDNDKYYYDNLFTIADVKNPSKIRCGNGAGSSGGGFGGEQARYGYKRVDRVCSSFPAADTLAHELGHMINLWHYSGYDDILNQDLNLMKTGHRQSKLFGFQWGVMHNILRQHQRDGTLYLDKPVTPPFEGEDTTAPVVADIKAAAKHLNTSRLSVLNDIFEDESGIDVASLKVVVKPTAGIVVANSDGMLTYRHNNQALLTDRVGFTVKDKAGNESEIVYVDIEVDTHQSIGSSKDYGLAINHDSANVGVGESAVIDILANDAVYSVAIDYDTLELDRWERPAHGTIMQNSDGTITYTHDGSNSETDKTKYEVLDLLGRGSVSGYGNINITIMDPSQDTSAPFAKADEFTVKQGNIIQINPSVNDIDSESGTDASSISVREQPLHGIVEYDTAGNFTYHHDGSETDSDRFSYRIKDKAGNISNLAWVTLNIQPTDGTVIPSQPGTPTIPTTPPTEDGGASKLPSTPGADIEEGGTVDPDVKPDTWDAEDVYIGGDEVRYDGKQWVAKWWTKGNEPSNSDVWQLNDPEAATQAWSVQKAYNGGDDVIFNSQTWQAAWWTKGEEPSNNSSVWKRYP
ncbi:MAG: Ig-like domain-containing protein [Moritella sp.]|uniref:Ig-like domain-containing protein n=1 Tax=Moritella sp. TaxID=78556 RepID=UPI0029B3CD1B|nr:Ig-like domain-containing protein [Moritella sp.]MDX2320785.1 Ig-like domain-containing protein [Moritella sp.]